MARLVLRREREESLIQRQDAVRTDSHAPDAAFVHPPVLDSTPSDFSTSPDGHQFASVKVVADLPEHPQAKLEVSEPGDSLEKEADRMADQVLRMPSPALAVGTIGRQGAALQRMCAECQAAAEDEEQKRRTPEEPVGERAVVRRKISNRDPVTDVPQDVVAITERGGRPLDRATRAFMEPRFGFQFDQVRIHADSQAAHAAEVMHARAYTIGSHIVFGEGQFAPGTAEGQGLLAHELTHVVQQSADTGQPRLQAMFVNEPNGGCGPCESAAETGKRLHTLIQEMFANAYGRRIVSEATFTLFDRKVARPASPTDDNGRLDLMQTVVTSDGVTIKIGEIKPNNAKGLRDGDTDLNFYKQHLELIISDVIVQDSPLNSNVRVTVEFMDLPIPQVSQLYSEGRGSCPPQLVIVGGGRQGLYLYSCVPPASVLAGCCDPDQSKDAKRQVAIERYTVTLRHNSGTNLTKEEALRLFKNELGWAGNRLDQLSGEHEFLKETHEEHSITSWIADTIGGADFPPLSIWNDARRQLDAARDAANAQDLDTALKSLVAFEKALSVARDTYFKYKDATISGAETALLGAEVVAVAAAVTLVVVGGALVLAPGAAAGAGAGATATTAASTTTAATTTAVTTGVAASTAAAPAAANTITVTVIAASDTAAASSVASTALASSTQLTVSAEMLAAASQAAPPAAAAAAMVP